MWWFWIDLLLSELCVISAGNLVGVVGVDHDEAPGTLEGESQ